jgi:hypothetical protein
MLTQHIKNKELNWIELLVGLERGPLSLVKYNWGATWKKK